MKSFDYYYITNGGDVLWDCEAAIRAGARIVQYREKSKSTRQMIEEAMKIKELCKGALFIINDRLDIALAVQADGVHLGQDDMPIDVAKKLFKGIIGVSAHNAEEARVAEAMGASYIGLGPIFATSTKKDARAPIGLKVIAETRQAVRIPIVAIGGITLESTGSVIMAGADSVAAISAVQPDVEHRVMQFRRLINEAKGHR